MPEPDLAQMIRELTPGALASFKRQINALPEADKQRAFSRLSAIPELSDILGRPTPTREITEEKPKPPAKESDIPLWQRALQVFGAPFRFVHEKAIEPALSLATAPFTPTTPETANLPWLQRQIAEYRGWQAPKIGLGFKTPEFMGGQEATLGVKGALEFLPWLAIPGVGGVAGKIGSLATKAGKLAPVVKGIAKGIEYSPWGLAEKGMVLPFKGVQGIIAKKKTAEIEKNIQRVEGVLSNYTEKRWAKAEKGMVGSPAGLLRLPKEARAELYEALTPLVGADWARQMRDWRPTKITLFLRNTRGILEGTLPPTGTGLGFAPLGQSRIVSEQVTPATKVTAIPKAKAVIPPTKPPRGVSELFPSGFSEKQNAAVVALLGMTKQVRYNVRETLQLRKPEQAIRAEKLGELRREYVAQGMTAKEAGNKAQQALAGEYPRAPMTPEFKKLLGELGEHEKTLFDMVAEAPFKSEFAWLNTHTALQDFLLENPMQLNQIARLEKVFGSELAKELMKKRPWLEKAQNIALEIANAPRALLASTDASYLLRQGGIAVAGYPKAAIKTFDPSLKAMFSDKYAMTMDDLIRARPRTDLGIEHGLAITPIPGKGVAVALVEREEPFMTTLFDKLAEHIPAFKKVNFIRASNRGYVTGLNDLRSQIWEQVLGIAEVAGRKVTELDLDELALFINAITGRGTLGTGALSRAGGLLNAIFFAPKLIASRIQVFRYLWSPSEMVRREAWRTLPRFFGTGIAMLTAGKLSGAFDVELDMRSADFGKLKSGETRLDIWTGYSQYMRFLAQLATAQRKTVGGRVHPLNRWETIDRFARTKFSPMVGFLSDLARGETYLGEELPPKSAKSIAGQFYERMAPLAIQDMIDGIRQDGILGGFGASVGLLGVGVTTYTDEVRRERDKVAKTQYGLSWAEVGQKYGKAEQLKLEQTSPTLISAEKEQEERFALGTPTTMKQFQAEGKAIEEVYREAINLASQEFRATNNGQVFRDKVDQASATRRTMYASRAKRKEFQDITAYYQQPLSPEIQAKMNPGDVLRREYYKQLFAADMFDQFGNYRFDEAERKEQEFMKAHGQQALDYIETYSGASWLDKPAELKMLEQARELLRPYWGITDNIWSMYPPELHVLSDQIQLMERTDPDRARQMLRRYPSILRARELIATYRKQMRERNPMIKQAYSVFYG